MKNPKIIVAFHIGKGGTFHNSGHISFIGEKNFQDLINLNSQNLFEKNKDEKGKFCKPYLTDSSGNFITDDDIRGEVGTLNFDHSFDTDYCKLIEDCSEVELEKIATSPDYKSTDLIYWLMRHNPQWKFDRYGSLIEIED